MQTHEGALEEAPPPSIRRHDKMSQSIFKSNVSKKLYLLKECNDVENLYKPIKNSIISTSYIILIILAEIYKDFMKTVYFVFTFLLFFIKLCPYPVTA